MPNKEKTIHRNEINRTLLTSNIGEDPKGVLIGDMPAIRLGMPMGNDRTRLTRLNLVRMMSQISCTQIPKSPNSGVEKSAVPLVRYLMDGSSKVLMRKCGPNHKKASIKTGKSIRCKLVATELKPIVNDSISFGG